MIEVVGVKFDNNNKTIYNFLPDNKKLKKGVTVIVETEKGLEFGKIELGNYLIENSKINRPLKKIVRIASKNDFLKYKKNEQNEKKALQYCKNLVRKNNLNMTIVDAHYTFNEEQLSYERQRQSIQGQIDHLMIFINRFRVNANRAPFDLFF